MSSTNDTVRTAVLVIVAAAVVLFILLMIGGGLAFFVYQHRMSERSRAIALEQRAIAEDRAGFEIDPGDRDLAPRNAALVEFLEQMLATATADADGNVQVTVEQMLAAAEEQAGRRELEPEVRAAIRNLVRDTRARLARDR